MTIAEIYKILKNPPNLQKHMLQVARVSVFIMNNWKGEAVNKDLIVRAALLHDVGNIVKFDMQKYPQFLGEEKERLQYWMDVQSVIIEKYGRDDHIATKQMLMGLGVKEEIVNSIYEMSYWNAKSIKDGKDMVLKILLYSDLRVDPRGVVRIKDRLDDLHARLVKYKDRMDLYEAGLAIEKQIQENLKIDVADITEDAIKIDVDELLRIQVDTNSN